MDAASWNPQDPALAPSHDEEFQQFLDMGGMGNLGDSMTFDFNDYQSGNGSAMMHQHGREQLDTQMGGTDASIVMGNTSSAMQAQLINMTTATAHPAITTQMIPPPTPTDAITEIDAQIQYLQQQRVQQQHRQIQEQHVVYYTNQPHAVPPTPQSLEMPPASNQFYSDQRQTPMFDGRYQRMKEQQDMAFTPLVSPAVTPLDPHFQMEAGGFTIPGAYFSPLTSPALHAQSDHGLLYDRRSSLSAHNSPAEMDVEITATNAQPSAIELSKKARKTNASRAKAKSGVRQSPISKPQRKKAGPTPKMVSQALTEMQEVNEDGLDQMLPSTALPAPMSSEESENASVSPENLSDMPPPPLPQPKQSSKSPFIQPQPQPQPHPAIPAHIQGKPSPATPASLMKLPSTSANNSTSSNPLDLGPSEHIESFELPESVNFNSRPQPPRLDTATPTQSPPDTGSRRPSFQPLPSPVFAKPSAAASASASPNLAPGSTGPSARRTPQLLARGSKSKRGSVSSVQVSPALRPRISPSIKPLLPGTPGGLSAEDTASRLLASKSNYQNILEGNTVPGVTYPSELSTNLTSKRTSHKIAEQGRRNRINSALQEIATLLPQPPNESKNSGDSDNADKKDAKAGGAPNSKASTVELAIEYIKQLKQEVAEANKRAEEAEKKLGLIEKPEVDEAPGQKEISTD
ncbi:Phosphorus acquisition-controlling protein [Colletotrichum truncatum]|uniref:Phosphorus acquisition-controlling protein n=1 Tax=Colletotrichum truncatum TaxID=5467 RepID=A0ACC3Z5G5_COLTU